MTGYRRHLHAAAVSISLKTNLHGLPGGDSAIPADIGGGVRVAATQVGIPGAGNTVVAGILPAGAPARFAGGAGIGHSNRASKTGTPGIGHHITAAHAAGIGKAAGRCAARCGC